MSSIAISRSSSWRWWVCGLLLLATTINYVDRQTLSQLKIAVEDNLGLAKQTDYGFIEGAFGLAFAVGSFAFGFLVDRCNVYWVYPSALIVWSIIGALTGFAEGFWSLFVMRVLLGFAVAANWPCALRTTQRILTPKQRPMGNGILQSGAAIGAALFPLVVLVLFDKYRPETWRIPFVVVGIVGSLWVILWWGTVRPSDLALPSKDAQAVAGQSVVHELPPNVFRRRFLVLVTLVITINMTWHYLRAWHPSYLQEVRKFEPEQVSVFSTVYYLSTMVGVLSAGYLAMALVGPRLSVHASRRLIFLCMGLLTTLCLAVPYLSHEWTMVGFFLVIGFGALGVFPCYYSFSQDLTTRNQGKVTGSLGACCWVAMFGWQVAIGQIVAWTGSYVIPFVISGLAPMFGFTMLLLFWGPTEEPQVPQLPEVAVTTSGAIQARDQGVMARTSST